MYLFTGGEYKVDGEMVAVPCPPEYACIVASRNTPAVQPWEWGLCDHRPQDWLDYVLMAISAENDPDVVREQRKRAAVIEKQIGKV
jgi:hypothetical protein